MLKRVLFFLFILLLPLAFVTAQEGNPFLSFDIGYALNSSITNYYDDTISFGVLGINARVADPLSVGFANYFGSTSGFPINIMMLKAKLDILPILRTVINWGNYNIAFLGGSVMGLGFEVIPLKRSLGGRLAEAKLLIEYNFFDYDFTDGDLFFGIGLSVGF